MDLYFRTTEEITLAISQDVVDSANGVSINQVTAVSIGIVGFSKTLNKNINHVVLTGDFTITDKNAIIVEIELNYNLTYYEL